MLSLPLIVVIWRSANRRHIAFFALLAYYLVAGRGLLPGASVFFSDPFSGPSTFAGLAVWVVPNVLLAATWAAFWGKNHHTWRLITIMLILSLPPIGIIGWANPITGAGAWFPATGWLGLLSFVTLLVLLATRKRNWSQMIAGLIIISFLTNVFYVIPKAENWIAIDTRFEPTRNVDEEYTRMRQVLSITKYWVEKAPSDTVLVLPEAIGGNWDINAPFWQRISSVARSKKITLLIGARRQENNSAQYVNGLFSIGLDGGLVLPGRMPVPISMWLPFNNKGAAAKWLHPGVTQVHGQTVAHLVCYEQLLIWPILRSMVVERPQVLVGVANDWWARETSIPAIQRQAIESWGRLFSIPVVFAGNQ
jgi:hypothetical protein